MGSDSTPVLIQSITPITTNPATNFTTNTAQRTTLKQQSVGENSNATTKQPSSPKTASRTASLPLTEDDSKVQITESTYIDQILNTSKNILDPDLFSLELEEITDCYQQSIYVFFLVSFFFELIQIEKVF